MLSEHDEYERSIIEGCLELEAELGFLHQREIQQPDADKTTQIQRLVEALRTAASEHEAMQRIPPPWDWDPSSHAFPGQTPKRKEHTMHGFQSAVRLEDDGRRATVQPSSSFPGHVLLDSIHALDPEAWLDGVPQIINDPEEQGEVQLVPSTADEPEDGESSASIAAMRPTVEAGGAQDETLAIRTHPYVRFPVLANDVSIRHIDIEAIFEAHRRELRPYVFLRNLRRLFALRVLDQAGVDLLVSSTEGLIGAVWYLAQKRHPKRQPVYAAEVFGNYLLAFDALMCVIELLGDYMELPLWWEEFVAAFNHDPSSLLPPVGMRAGGLYRRLIARIVNALNVYKTGRRPALSEVIALKKMLFCPPSAPGDFKDHKWDPWREDAECP
ncbi:hypothetical protein EMWEY_00011830 [Eimeria maxima]|uniref:Uncharacterized protein n=1 Tax=Eimeria maxima TaxID=5804 RepID=U6MCG9_EIMMA|nr:hypothetical protein EMWEY_00011830 [Eimeria maxima]CDJ61716.1 hypothetical protein EMWEY_00011830 [Eimeria maxima]